MEAVNTDEAKVPEYTLPEPLVTGKGERITRANPWKTKRREIRHLFEKNLYGRVPVEKIRMEVEPVSEDADAVGGKAKMKQVRLRFENRGKSLRADLLIFTPVGAAKPVPVFLGMNFYGNHTILDDPRIGLHQSWTMNSEQLGITDNKASPASRGLRSFRWPVDKIVERGYGLATLYYGDIDPDFDDGFKNGIHGLFTDASYDVPPDERWGSIAAWSWGLSRALDTLEKDPAVDGKRVVVIGHSRLGKASLWAGATDERFAAVASNDSGCAGSALFRRRFGERLALLNQAFPHWMNDRSLEFDEKEDTLPVDQHELVALVAPRPIHVASASEDLWADPKGEFLSLVHADPVYRLLSADGLPTHTMPPPQQPVIGRMSYHLREGKHNILAYDWDQYLNWADRYV